MTRRIGSEKRQNTTERASSSSSSTRWATMGATSMAS